MRLTVEVLPEVAAQFRAKAEAPGIPLQLFVADWPVSYAPASLPPSNTVETAQQALNIRIQAWRHLPELTDEMLRRDNLYTEHDER